MKLGFWVDTVVGCRLRYWLSLFVLWAFWITAYCMGAGVPYFWGFLLSLCSPSLGWGCPFLGLLCTLCPVVLPVLLRRPPVLARLLGVHGLQRWVKYGLRRTYGLGGNVP